MGSDWDEIEGRTTEPPDLLPRILVIGAIAAAGVLAWVHFSGESEKASPAGASAELANARVTESMNELPRVEITGVVPVPGAVAAGERAYGADGTTSVGVYECQVNGQRVVSDVACGPTARERVIEFDPATAPAPPVPVYRPSQPAHSAPIRNAGESVYQDTGGNADACAAVDQAIEQLNAQMRQGYTSQEGERLRARWHRIQDQRQALKCGR